MWLDADHWAPWIWQDLWVEGFPWKSGDVPSLFPVLPTAVPITVKQQVLSSCFPLWLLGNSSGHLEDCLLLVFFWIVCLFPFSTECSSTQCSPAGKVPALCGASPLSGDEDISSQPCAFPAQIPYAAVPLQLSFIPSSDLTGVPPGETP